MRERRLGKPGQSFAHNSSHPPPLHCPQKHYSMNRLLETLGGITWEEMPSNQQLGEQCGGSIVKRRKTLSVSAETWGTEVKSSTHQVNMNFWRPSYICTCVPGTMKETQMMYELVPSPKGRGTDYQHKPFVESISEFMTEFMSDVVRPTIPQVLLVCFWNVSE